MSGRNILVSLAALALINAAVPAVSASTNDHVSREHAIPIARSLSITATNLPPMPAGVYGAFVQAAEQTIVVAGGVTRIDPDMRYKPSDFSRKVFYLEPGALEWREADFELPVAFGSAASFENSVFCFGGVTPDGPSSNAWRIVCERVRDGETGVEESKLPLELKLESLPSLPAPLAFSGAAVKNGEAFLIGGATGLDPLEFNSVVYSLSLPRKPVFEKKFDLMQWLKAFYTKIGHTFMSAVSRDFREAQAARKTGAAPPAKWNAVEPLQVEGLLFPVLSVRRHENILQDVILVFGGWSRSDSAYVPRETMWRYIPKGMPQEGWSEISVKPADFIARATVPIGPAHVFLVGEPERSAENLGEIVAPKEASRPLLQLYHMVTEQWVDLSESLGRGLKEEDWSLAVRNINAFTHKGADVARDLAEEFVITASAEDDGEFRGRIWLASIEYTKRGFGWADYLALAVYFGVLIGIGIYFSKRERGTEDFFLGGRKIPWWAAGLSIYATGVSAISFMAIPAKTYATNWLYIPLGIFPVFGGFVAAYFFVPVLRRLQITTIMEYFEMRFNKGVRTIASVQNVCLQVFGRLAITLLLPSIALSAVTGLDRTYCIIIMGVFATTYTIMGGIGAVIWTDVIQVVVLFGGAIAAFFIIVFNVHGGLGGMISVCMDYNKFDMIDTTFDLRIATIWVFLIWGAGIMVSQFAGQEGMQRAFSTSGVKEARRSFMTSAIVSIPGTLLFYGLGAALFAYFHQEPETLNPNLHIDGTFPLFIVQKMPAGLAGIVIAGLFAAAMSTLDSSMNTVSTVIVRDWFAAFNKNTSDKVQLWVARWITLIVGVAGTLMALYLSSRSQGSLWDTFSVIMSLLASSLGGAAILGMVTKRGSGRGVLVSIPLNISVVVSIRVFTDLHFFTYGTIILLITCPMAYLLSLIFPDPPKDLAGLTLWTPKKSEDE